MQDSADPLRGAPAGWRRAAVPGPAVTSSLPYSFACNGRCQVLQRPLAYACHDACIRAGQELETCCIYALESTRGGGGAGKRRGRKARVEVWRGRARVGRAPLCVEAWRGTDGKHAWPRRPEANACFPCPRRAWHGLEGLRQTRPKRAGRAARRPPKQGPREHGLVPLRPESAWSIPESSGAESRRWSIPESHNKALAASGMLHWYLHKE